jgi:hypothetical protein
MLPIRIRPLSEMTVGLSFVLTASFDLAIGKLPYVIRAGLPGRCT